MSSITQALLILLATVLGAALALFISALIAVVRQATRVGRQTLSSGITENQLDVYARISQEKTITWRDVAELTQTGIKSGLSGRPY